MTVIQEQVLAKIPGRPLRAHAIFLPILEEDDQQAADRMMSRLRDNRITGYWDPDHALSRQVHQAIRLPDALTAWDVYLAYGKGRTGRGALPPPDFWMHQLSKLTARKDLELDGAAFLAKLQPLLAAASA